MSERSKRPENEAEDGGMACVRCGRALRPRDAEAADGLALSESANLVHRDESVCRAAAAEDELLTLEAMLELEELGLWEIRIGDDEGPGNTHGARPPGR